MNTTSAMTHAANSLTAQVELVKRQVHNETVYNRTQSRAGAAVKSKLPTLDTSNFHSYVPHTSA